MSLTEKIPNCIFIPHSKLYAFAWISNRQPPACIPRDSRSVVPASQNLLKWDEGHRKDYSEPPPEGSELILSASLASLRYSLSKSSSKAKIEIKIEINPKAGPGEVLRGFGVCCPCSGAWGGYASGGSAGRASMPAWPACLMWYRQALATASASRALRWFMMSRSSERLSVSRPGWARENERR